MELDQRQALEWPRKRKLKRFKKCKRDQELEPSGEANGIGLASSLESVSAEALEATAPPPRENLTEEKDAAIKHLMKTLLDEVGIRTEQLLKAETVQITVADEAAAEATNDTMNVCLEGSEEKHLDLQVSSNKDVADAIGELLETLFDDALLASLQPLENKIMDTNLAETEEDTQEKHLDHLVSSNKDVADAIGELLEIMFDDASLHPLEDKTRPLMKISDSEANDQTYPDLEDLEPTDTHPLARDEQLKDDVAEPKIAEEHLDLKETSNSDDLPLDVKKSPPPEEQQTSRRKTRRGTRGKGRKILYNKEQYPKDKLDGKKLLCVQNIDHSGNELQLSTLSNANAAVTTFTQSTAEPAELSSTVQHLIQSSVELQ
ncbi:hypothetical protein MHYP_G00102680 [Metynnis hypsauchen]